MNRAQFDSTKQPLNDLLFRVRDGQTQLPDFQRGWVWDDEGLRSLLASISQSFPVGAIMTLKTGGEVRFKPRTIEGAPAASAATPPESLLLDGQQRLTSLYQTTMRCEVVETMNSKRQKIRRFYFIDMRQAISAGTNQLDAIIGLPENRIETKNFGREVVRDLSSSEAEFEQCMFPTNRIFDWNDWQMGFVQHWVYDPEKTKFWFEFFNEVLSAFHQYQMPLIELGRSTSREAVCLVFEKVNTGGKKLDAFELLTAIYAGEEEGFLLREEWATITSRLRGSIPLKDHPLTRLEPTEFFQALALLHTYGKRREDLRSARSGEPPAVSCTRDTVLRVPLAAYKREAMRLEEGFRRAGKFLFSQNIYWYKDVPYQSQLVPLAAILAELGDRWEQDTVRKKLAQWYWCGVFGELYGSAVESRFAKDLVEVLDWIDGGGPPTTVNEGGFRAQRLDTMTSRLSAAYKGVLALLMNEGARDFRSGQPFNHTTYFEEAVDIHHVFPRAWCQKAAIQPKIFDTIVNKTPLSHKTNRAIGGDAPSRYLARLSQMGGGSPDGIDAHLRSHLIDPEILRNDDFAGFLALRREALLELIGKATGKDVYRGSGADEPVEDVIEIDDDGSIAA